MAGQLRILSRSSEPFRDREEAGRLLAKELSNYRGKKAVALGIPRGGVVVANEIANALDAELDIVLARKLRTPGYEELAMGSVAEDGKLFLNQEVVRQMAMSEIQIQNEKDIQLAEIRRRTELIRHIRPKVELKGRIVVVSDDGVATGATTQAALWAVRMEQPSKLIAAIPVGPEDTIIRLAKDVDEMLCLRTPPLFAAVGQFYQRFHAVEDNEVLEILGEAAKRKQPRESSQTRGRSKVGK
jgi:putative phosphoribosyl transferase